MRRLDQPHHDFAQRSGDLALRGAQFGERFCSALRHFIEFHDQVFDHGRLDAGVTDKPETIVADLKDERLALGADEAPLRFTVDTARRVVPQALGGHLPESFPIAVYMRDRPTLPADANILAVDSAGEPALFQIRDNCFGFLGHPGIKSAMIEDLIMEFDETPARTAETLEQLRGFQGEIARALGAMAVGVVEAMRLM